MDLKSKTIDELQQLSNIELWKIELILWNINLINKELESRGVVETK
jgi:hypothetical protein